MKLKYKEQIGDITIIRHIANALVDSEKTKLKIKELVTPEMERTDIERLYMGNLVYAKVGPEADLVEDDIGDQIQQKLDARGENRLLLDSGEYIADFRGTEYWIKKSGTWEKEKIGEIGISLPSGAVLPENLTSEQQQEIAEQEESERIAAMSDEEKAEAKQSALNALADEADRLDRRSKIQQQPFDPIIWYRENVGAVEAKYA